MKRYGSLVEIKPLREADSDDESDVSKEDAEATTSLLRTKRPLGQPEVTKRFWFSKVKANPGEDIATQVGSKGPQTGWRGNPGANVAISRASMMTLS